MNLESAVEMGRFCGLTTVKECMDNILLHATQVFKYTEMREELEELHEDYDLYLDGHYNLDIEKIDRINKIKMQDWEDAMEKAYKEDPSPVEDFNFKE